MTEDREVPPVTTTPAQWLPAAAPGGAPPGRGRKAESGPVRVTGARRRRRVPYLAAGVLLVLGCAVAGVLVATRLGATEPVLVLARPVAVGQVLTEQDLREEAVATTTGIEAVSAAAMPEIVGRPVAYSLPAGTLLTRAVLGAPQVPPPGQAITAVALDAGRFPPDLAPGTHVTVVAAANSAAFGSQPPAAAAPQVSTWPATVTAVEARENERTTVVSLLLAEGDAGALAAAPDCQVRVVAVHGGGR